MTSRQRTGNQGPRCALGLGIWLSVVFGSSAWAAERPSKLVVVVYPDESDGAPGIILVNRAIRSTFATESNARVDIHNEYVDTSRLGNLEYKSAQVAVLKQKYA